MTPMTKDHLNRIEEALLWPKGALNSTRHTALESLTAIRATIAELERDRDERLTSLMESAERWEAKCVALRSQR